MITLSKVPYDLNADNELVRGTLQTKKMSQVHPGIGPHSCWAGVAYFTGTRMGLQTGCSQMKSDLEYSPYKNQWVKYHGELSGLCQAIEAVPLSGRRPEGIRSACRARERRRTPQRPPRIIAA